MIYMNKSDLEFLNSFAGKYWVGASDTPLTFALTDEVYNGLSAKTFADLEEFYSQEWSIMDVDEAIGLVEDLDMNPEDLAAELDNLKAIKRQNSEAVIGYDGYYGFYAMNVDDFLDLLARFVDYEDRNQVKKVL